MFGKGEKNANDSQEQSGFDLKKLKRVDLLELLYEQASESEANAASVAELTELTDRLKAKLDEKDTQIEHLKQRLDEKDAKIAELQEANSLYVRAFELVDANELAKFQEKALREYLSTLVADKNSADANRMARARHAEVSQEDAAAQND